MFALQTLDNLSSEASNARRHHILNLLVFQVAKSGRVTPFAAKEVFIDTEQLWTPPIHALAGGAG